MMWAIHLRFGHRHPVAPGRGQQPCSGRRRRCESFHADRSL